MREALRAITPMGLAFAFVLPLSVWLARPFQMATAPIAPQDPTDGASLGILVGGALGFVALAIALAVFILWAVRTGRKGIVRAVVLASVATSLLIVIARPLMLLSTYIDPDLAWGLGLAATAALAYAVWRKPDWRLLNTVGLLVAAAVAALAGAVLGLTPLLLLLVAIAIYDHVAVKRTKHMVKLARTAMDLRLPIALQFGGPMAPPKPATSAEPRPAPGGASTAPTHAPNPSANAPAKAPANPPANPPANAHANAPAIAPTTGPGSAPKPRKRGYTMVLGLGDLVFPAALLVAVADPRMGWGIVPALTTCAGIAAGFALLMRAALTGKAQPGLPLLNGGAIVGFFIGLVAATRSIVFW